MNLPHYTRVCARMSKRIFPACMPGCNSGAISGPIMPGALVAFACVQAGKPAPTAGFPSLQWY